MPPDIEKNVNALLESGEFTTKSDLFIAALRFYFEYRDAHIEKEIERFFISEKGEEYLTGLIKKIKESEK